MPLSPQIPDPNFEALRLKLSQLRHERKWSYDELAERTGISRRGLIAIEVNSGTRPSRGSLETWYRIAHAFDIPLGDLLAPLERE